MWSRVPFGEELRAELGPPRRARRLVSSPRSRVWRIELDGRPAVVKQAVEGADAEERYARELAGLRIAARAPLPVVPAVLGADPAARVLVLEHLDHQRPSGDWIVAYADALARMHATAGPQDAHALPRWQGPDRADVDSFLTLAATLGVPAPAGLAATLGELVDRLGSTPGHALLHGDPCPGNDLHTADGVRFIDFEQASLGSGLVELAYLRIGFPTCWCVTSAPDPLLSRAETAYRTAWHTATGTHLGDADLTDACTGWLLRGDALVPRAERGTTDHLARLPHTDWTWGTATARRRLAHRLGVVGQLTVRRPDLRDLGVLCADLRNAALSRWPALPPVPAERP
ncbi:aminoglycoside phosphotransferase family protein [Kitasatospora sp. NPDC051853]|uniref:aminoglycoside phosphotransferase family protein n=1 Tax=Kitasatospora sp. NPDC051853 TaxID=3364058 RepID=UPI00379AA14C